MMLKKVCLASSLAAAGFLLASPSAHATYFSYGVLYAKEGSIVVAEGKGNHGIDFPTNAWGGHIGSRDPRPGGSPAYGEIRFNWVKGGVVVNTSSAQSSRNSTAAWVDQPKYGALGTMIRQGQSYAKACQDDTAGPDACASSPIRNHAW